MQSSSFLRSPPPPPLDLHSAAPATSFVFTSSQYQPSSPSSHSRHASLSRRSLKEHANGAFGARASPESLLPPGFVQLSTNTTNATTTNTITTQALTSDPVPSSSRPLWLPRFSTGAHQPPATMLSTASESPIYDVDSYFPPHRSSGHGTSTGNTSPVCSTASSPMQSSTQPLLPASPRRTTTGLLHELSLTELMNGTNVFGSSVDTRDGAGPRYQTLPRPPRPVPPKVRGERKRSQSDLPEKRRTSHSTDATIVTKFDAIDTLKSELCRLSVAAGSVPEVGPAGNVIEKSGHEAEPHIALWPLTL